MRYQGVDLIDEILSTWPKDDDRPKRPCTHRRAGKLIKGKVFCRDCGSVVTTIAR